MTSETTNAPLRAFDEVWQARAHAIAQHLSEAGHFSWSSWTLAFGEQLRRVEAETDCGADGYYLAWQRTLERLLLDGGLITTAEYERFRSAWTTAFRRTAHGQPIELTPADFDRPG
jgi:nitrile hydratase accessory protein